MEKLRSDLMKESEATPSEVDDGVYEEIEAPKFVDFSLPDCSRPDDRSWFCSRVGCDQNHEEVDPDALLRSFRIRVIEGRSPNVCRRKAWDREAPSLIPKCPKSAPAKSLKCRTAGRSTVTSVAENMAKTKLMDHPLSSLRLTPGDVKSRSQHSKRKEALTTPKIQKRPTNQEDFRSVSQQREPVSVVMNKSVAKSLFVDTVAAAADTTNNKEKPESSSPSKCETSVSDVCVKMKKVKVTKRVKNVPSRYLCIPKNQKSSKNAEDSAQNLNKADKTKSKMKLKSGASSIFCIPSNDFKADKEMDCHATAKGDKQFLVVNSDKECLNLETQSGEKDSVGLIKSRKIMNCEKDIQDKVSLPHSSSKPDSGAEKVEAMSKVDDEKENAPSTKKRVVSSNTRNYASENIMSATRENDPQKEVRPHIKSTTETSDREKHKRTITNPRPFRLRVDERRILKEANQERRLQVEAQAQKKSESNLKHAEVIKVVTTKEKTTKKMVEPSRQTSKDRSVTTLRKPLDAKLGRGNSKIKNPFVIAKGTRPTTVPREPNFHTVHLPRGCSKRVESKS
ncbi:uncharacterized protein LOC122001220 [Zingiber officinale]|uniref:uncharacterized protein LOC122001220 n=1 Tax=Zingiber officinale TaxID=94328 RepID=UPI001C4C9572|nr:uncharacterized protein LOC122001220 [Zingiber officinale]